MNLYGCTWRIIVHLTYTLEEASHIFVENMAHLFNSVIEQYASNKLVTADMFLLCGAIFSLDKKSNEPVI